MQHFALRKALADRQGDRALHQEITRTLENLITTGHLAVGDRLPSERQLTELSGASRVTIRKALNALAEGGLIEQRHGSGSYVKSSVSKLPSSVLPVMSLSEELRHRGQVSRTIWLSKQMGPARFQDMRVLGLTLTDSVARLERLRLVDERPLSVERSVFRADVLPDLSVLEQSVYAVLKELGTLPARVAQDVTAVNMAPKEASRLNALPAAAGLKITRTGFDRNGEVIEFTEAVFRPDAYQIVMEFGRLARNTRTDTAAIAQQT